MCFDLIHNKNIYKNEFKLEIAHFSMICNKKKGSGFWTLPHPPPLGKGPISPSSPPPSWNSDYGLSV